MNREKVANRADGFGDAMARLVVCGQTLLDEGHNSWHAGIDNRRGKSLRCDEEGDEGEHLVSHALAKVGCLRDPQYEGNERVEFGIYKKKSVSVQARAKEPRLTSENVVETRLARNQSGALDRHLGDTTLRLLANNLCSWKTSYHLASWRGARVGGDLIWGANDGGKRQKVGDVSVEALK